MKNIKVEQERVPEKVNISNSYELVASAPSDSTEVCLSWNDITFTAKDTKILKGVTGYANPKEILAIMGSSGCGKTSLLSILSQQLFPSDDIKVSGTVEINSQNVTTLKYQTYCRYVTQQDILLPTLTPRESLMFTARLKVKGPQEELAKKVDNLIVKLNIAKAADNIVGNEYIKGLSGGEKKRLSIGMEMISDPLILILDEPTSGLDSHTAKLIIRLLKEDAASGKTVLLTIHQPGQEIYESFDRLILMVAGNFVFQGPRKDAQAYFDSIGFNCPSKTLPQDYFMRVLHLQNIKDLTEEETNKIEFLNQKYKSPHQPVKSNESLLPHSANEFHPGLFRSIFILFQRSLLNVKRNPMLFRVKIVQSILMSAVIALIFRHLGYDNVEIKNRNGVLYFVTINCFMLGVLSNSTTFPAERPLFLKEYKETLYGVIPYYFSKFLAEFPTIVIFSLLYSLIMYFSCNLNTESAKHYFIFLGIITLLQISGMSLGNLAGIIAPSFGLAIFFGATMAVPLILFGGFFSNTNSMTTAFGWIKYISSFSRGYEGLVLNEYDGLPIDSGLNPVQMLGFSGEIWEKVGELLLIIAGTICLAIGMLKITAVRASYR